MILYTHAVRTRQGWIPQVLGRDVDNNVDQEIDVILWEGNKKTKTWTKGVQRAERQMHRFYREGLK